MFFMYKNIKAFLVLFFIAEMLTPAKILYAVGHRNGYEGRYSSSTCGQEGAIIGCATLGVGLLVVLVVTCSLGLCKPSDRANSKVFSQSKNVSPCHLDDANITTNNTNSSAAIDSCVFNSTNATTNQAKNSTAAFKDARLQQLANRRQFYNKRNN